MADTVKSIKADPEGVIALALQALKENPDAEWAQRVLGEAKRGLREVKPLRASPMVRIELLPFIEFVEKTYLRGRRMPNGLAIWNLVRKFAILDEFFVLPTICECGHEKTFHNERNLGCDICDCVTYSQVK